MKINSKAFWISSFCACALSSALIAATQSQERARSSGTTQWISRSEGAPADSASSGAPTSANTPQAALDREEKAFLQLINDYRAQKGCGPLKTSTPLTRAAEWLNKDMAQKDYFDHKDSQGRTLDRYRAFGYVFETAAENIYAGKSLAREAFEGWRKSPGHNRNMLRCELREIGISRYFDASSTYKWYWTTAFGTPLKQ